MKRTTLSERALVLAPLGRDAPIAAAMLQEGGIGSTICASVPDLLEELNAGAAFVLLTEEAIEGTDLSRLHAWLDDQEEWSDLPFVLLTRRGGGLERNPGAARHLEVLGNVTFLERPFHPTTLISLARSALRGRQRQYEARARLVALRDSEERYRTLFDTMDEGFCVLEPRYDPVHERTDLLVVEANPAFERHTGLAAAQGRWLRSLTPDLEEHWYEIYERIARTGVPERFDEGSAALGRWFDVYSFSLDGPNENLVAVLFHDVSDRRASEQRLRDLNETLESQVAERSAERDRTWKLSQDLFGIADARGYFFRTNPAWQRVLGWTEEEIATTPFLDLVHPDDIGRTLGILEELANGQSTMLFENRYRARDGSYRWFSWSATPEEGLYYCVARDITDDKLRAEELEAAQTALRQSQKMEAMGQLTGGVAHDFNNLLTPIVGSLDLLKRRGIGGPREQRLIEGAIQSAERAKVLVQRLLAFARRQPLQTFAVDIGKLIAGMSELITSTTGPTIKLAIVAPPDLPPAKVDPNQLEMALLNLAVNARDAMPDGGELRISAKPRTLTRDREDLEAGAYLRPSVTDTGIGMDEATRARAVEPFYSTKGVGKGTGLGLSMVHGLASQLGGALRIRSEAGNGTRIELWLPQTEALPADAGAAADTFPPLAAPGTVLLVDDEDVVRASTADMLTEFGYDVAEASCAEDALAMIERGLAFDLLVTDHVMPGMTGAELARVIVDRSPETPVLLISGYADGEGVDAALPRLAKPFRAGELLNCLKQLQARKTLRPIS